MFMVPSQCHGTATVKVHPVHLTNVA